MASVETGPALLVRLLLQERDKLMGELVKGQIKLAAAFSDENFAQLKELVTRLEIVRTQMKAQNHSEAQVALPRSEVRPTTVDSSVADKGSLEGEDKQPPASPIRFAKPGEPQTVRCTKCGKRTAYHPAKTNSLCMRCKEDTSGGSSTLRHELPTPRSDLDRSEAMISRSQIGSHPGKQADIATAKQGLREVDKEGIRRMKNDEEPVKLAGTFTGKKQRDNMKLRENIEADHGTDDIIVSHPRAHVDLRTPRDFDQLNSTTYPTVIYFKDAWYEIWCHICGANVGTHKGRENYGHFFRGIHGLQAHIKLSHKVDPKPSQLERMGYEEVVRFCGKREISADDVRLIGAGDEPKKKQIQKYEAHEELFKGTPSMCVQALYSSSHFALSSATPRADCDSRVTVSGATTNGDTSFFAEFHKPRLTSNMTASTPQPPRPTSTGPLTSGNSMHNKRARSPSPDPSTYDRRASIGSAPSTRYDQFKNIVAKAEKGSDYRSGRDKRIRRVSTADGDDDYEDRGSNSGSENDDVPLFQRRRNALEAAALHNGLNL